MRSRLALLALLIAAPAIAGAQADTTKRQYPARPTDVASIDAILKALYDVISGPAGPRDWDRMRSLFVPDARLIAVGYPPNRAPILRSRSVEEYILSGTPFFNQNGFFEREAARRMERFGGVVHVFSTYESRHAATDSVPFTRGINSIQLWFDGTRWWVVTVYWESERPGSPIPAEYLPKP